MKAAIQPTWYDDAKVSCACGNTFATGSTQQIIKVELCNACHPFYTGQQKFVDTLGQVDRFQKKQEIAKAKKTEIDQIKVNRAAKAQKNQGDKPSLKDLLMQARKSS